MTTVLLSLVWALCTCQDPPAAPVEESPAVKVERKAKEAHAAIRRAFDFLQKTQGKDGAWGSHDPVVIDSAQLGFGMHDLGSHDGVRTACTAICAKAMLLYPHRTPEDEKTLERAIENLFKHTQLAYDPGNAFNVWGYAYILDWMTALNGHPLGKKYSEQLKKAIPEIIAGLKKMQVVEGGWAYYTSVMLEGSSISFTTSSIAISLIEAKAQGFEIPKGILEDVAKVLRTMIFPNNQFMYGAYLKYSASHYLEDLSSGGRTQVCGLALHRLDNTYSRKELLAQSDDYFKNVDYVETIGNKRIIPHRDAPQNISGYFLYYGCYYAAELLTFLGKDANEKNWERLLSLIQAHQEPEGSWWDTICYDYGDKWGTGFAVLCLEHYLKAHGMLEKRFGSP